MKKRIGVCLLALLLTLSVLAVPAGAIPTELRREGDWVIGVEDTPTLRNGIMRYTGKAAHVTIPRMVGGFQVDHVFSQTFANNTTMKTLTVPEGVSLYGLYSCHVETVNLGENTRIGAGACKGCKYLKKINIPNSWDKIVDRLFDGCISLTAVKLHEGIESIGYGAFDGCTSLESVNIPASVTEIYDEAFQNCVSLTSVTLPQGLKEIKSATFMGSGLRSITIPKSVEQIAYDAFSDCDNLVSIIVEEGNAKFYADEAGNLYEKNGEDRILVRAAVKNTDYTINENVTKIGGGAFYGTDKLTRITIPAHITEIKWYAFGECKQLKEIWFEGRPNISSYAFQNVTATVYYPGDSEKWTNAPTENYTGRLNWVPYCSGIHIGPEGKVLTESTCVVPGIAETVCSLCGKTYTHELALADHSYGEGQILTPSTCVTTGKEEFTCTDCGYKKIEELFLADHELVNAVHESNGRHKGECMHCGSFITTVCNYKIKEEIIPATCSEIGEAILVCINCGYEYRGFTNRLPHDFEGAEPEFIGGNMHQRYCSQCEKMVQDVCERVESYQEATVTRPGMPLWTCKICGHVRGTPMSHYRISGSNRFETAFKVADEMRNAMGVEKFDTVIVASGVNFADALSGSYLAAVKNAPILLSYNQEYNERAKIYIRTHLNTGGTVYILGGENAVPTSMEEGLDEYTVKRLAGGNRFETNLVILEEAGVGDKPVLICTGLSFADSLSASASELPILLVWNDLTEGQKTLLEGLGGDNPLYVIGGEGAVSASMEEQVAIYGDVKRIGGSNRFETSVKIAEEFFDAPKSILLAYAWNYPDGLCGGPLAAVLDVPLILTMEGFSLQADIYGEKMEIAGGATLGGENLIPEYLVREILQTRNS